MKIDKSAIQCEVFKVFKKYSNFDVTIDTEISSLELDSLDFVKLIIELEDSYDIEIDDEALYVINETKVSDYIEFIITKLT